MITSYFLFHCYQIKSEFNSVLIQKYLQTGLISLKYLDFGLKQFKNRIRNLREAVSR